MNRRSAYNTRARLTEAADGNGQPGQVSRGSLKVVLDRVRRACGRLARVLVELRASPALSKQVPALIELFLDAAEPVTVGALALPQPMLLVDQALDAVQDLGFWLAHAPQHPRGPSRGQACWLLSRHGRA